jgi:hypothetical protein
MRVCKIDTTAMMARLLAEGRKQGEIIEAWTVGDDQLNRLKTQEPVSQGSNACPPNTSNVTWRGFI